MIFLSPYSPDYNPIELVWNATKIDVKKHGAVRPGENGELLWLQSLNRSVSKMDLVGAFKKCGYFFLADGTFDIMFGVTKHLPIVGRNGPIDM